MLSRVTSCIPSALEALRANKSRSVLTTLGIVIGVVAVIVIVGLGQGSTAQVTSQISNLGTNVLTIQSGSTASSGIRGGAGTQTTLKAEDSEAIEEQVAGVAAISPTVSGSAQIIAGSQNWSTRVQAVEPAYQQIQNWQVAEGGFFSDEDNLGARERRRDRPDRRHQPVPVRRLAGRPADPRSATCRSPSSACWHRRAPAWAATRTTRS